MTRSARVRARARVGAHAAVLGLAAVLTMALSACTGADHPSPSASATASSSRAPSSVSDVQHSVLAPATPAPAVASQSAQVHLTGAGSATVSLTAEVVSVQVNGATTVLHWRLKSGSGSPVDTVGNWASGGDSSASDTRDVALTDPAGKVRLLPYLNAGQAIFGNDNCLCSDTPRRVDANGVDMYATYPAVSAAATTVTVSIPGFSPMDSVPVTRG